MRPNKEKKENNDKENSNRLRDVDCRLDVESYEDVIRAALADRAFLPDHARLRTAALLPTYLDRPTVAMLSRVCERRRHAYIARGGRKPRDVYGERTTASRHGGRCMYYGKRAGIPTSVVELINIPCSLMAQRGTARRPVFPRNKQTLRRRHYDSEAE